MIAAYTVCEETDAGGVKGLVSGGESWLGRSGYLDGPAGGDGLLRDVCGIAMDGSYGWLPIVGHRGSAQFALATRGRAAHASTPHLGSSATELMSMLLLHLRESEDRLQERLLTVLEPSLLGPPTAAIGTTIVGGGIRSVTLTEAVPASSETASMRYRIGVRPRSTSGFRRPTNARRPRPWPSSTTRSRPR